ncbi:GNAT family N-acetyltransferase [Nocardia sp. NPDC051030]|uniref:GNAT family N-acetyltransferase n=1 Tax=Nocardia sp. NPDC051030 TaxID=3155162 RepID=UPI003415F2BD
MPDAVGQLIVSTATQAEWSTVTEWAADEGWSPGERDVTAFFAQDPEGFLLGRLDGEPVSAVSVVNYGAEFAFLGFYLVRPDLRGHGFGLATWQAGLRHGGDRVVGLDGVVDQQDNYRRSGFELAYRTARFTGAPQLPPPDGTVRPLSPADLRVLHAYDSSCVPADRPALLNSWLALPERLTVVRIVDGEFTGYGTIRPARDSLRIGPLFANSAEDARQILAALVEQTGAKPLAIDVPLNNADAVRLAEEAGLTPSFETARMYTGRTRSHTGERVFGVTSLELG